MIRLLSKHLLVLAPVALWACGATETSVQDAVEDTGDGDGDRDGDTGDGDGDTGDGDGDGDGDPTAGTGGMSGDGDGDGDPSAGTGGMSGDGTGGESTASTGGAASGGMGGETMGAQDECPAAEDSICDQRLGSCVEDTILKEQLICSEEFTSPPNRLGTFVACGEGSQCSSGQQGCDTQVTLGEVQTTSQVDENLRTTNYQTEIIHFSLAGTVQIESERSNAPSECDFAVSIAENEVLPLEIVLVTEAEENACSALETVRGVDVAILADHLEMSMSGNRGCSALGLLASGLLPSFAESIEDAVLSALQDQIAIGQHCEACTAPCEQLRCLPPAEE